MLGVEGSVEGHGGFDWIVWMDKIKVHEADQVKIFNRSVKELILTRSKFQSANSGTYKQT